MMDQRLAAMLPTTLFVINLQTGAITELGHWNDWTNHQQFSPIDPPLLMFAHEGRQWKVNRIWLIRTDGHSAPMLVHQRTMKMEIAVHEYWANDGSRIYYDLQTPLSGRFLDRQLQRPRRQPHHGIICPPTTGPSITTPLRTGRSSPATARTR